MRKNPLLVLAVLTACGQAPKQQTQTDDGSPKCDNVLQDSEKPVKDGQFDVDGDGFVDGDTPDCQAHYPSSQLDCDDTDPNVNPQVQELTCNGLDDDCDPSTEDDEDKDSDGVTLCEGDCDDFDETRAPAFGETCWDGVDNDCDQDVDEDCGPDYNGRFAVTPPVAYQCGLQTIANMDFYAIDVIYIPPYISFLPVGPGFDPGILSGEMPAGESAFDVRNWVLLGTPVACDEYYMMVGEFLDVDTLEMTFDFWYDGPPLGCLNCSQDGFTVPMVATRVPNNWTPGGTGTGTGTGTGMATGTGTGMATGTGTGMATGTGTGAATGTGTGLATGTGTGIATGTGTGIATGTGTGIATGTGTGAATGTGTGIATGTGTGTTP